LTKKGKGILVSFFGT